MSKTRLPTTLTLAVLLVLAVALGVLRRPHHAAADTAPIHNMNDMAMARTIDAWYAAHPAHGGSIDAAPADTFLVISFRFDTDGNAGTQVDTAKIFTGQSVLFKWVSGLHTTTSGNPGDVNAGSRWDHAINGLAGNQEFTVTFDSVGTFPFHCRPHGSLFNMVGAVVVSTNPAGVTPVFPVAGRIGFVAMPWPNPTHTGANFRFAIDRPGRVRVRIYDATGRAVATAIDQDLGAGTYAGNWDGRVRGATPAPAGVYYLRLEGPGVNGSRRVVVSR